MVLRVSEVPQGGGSEAAVMPHPPWRAGACSGRRFPPACPQGDLPLMAPRHRGVQLCGFMSSLTK